MKKNYFLTLVVTLLMAVTASAADSLVGIYKLSNLTDEQTEALGSINADAAIRILPGDAAADYYVSGIAGYGCKLAATYDATAGTLTVVDQGPYGKMAMVLYFGDLNVVAVDDTSVTFNVKTDGTLEIASDFFVTGMFTGEVYGEYIPGVTLTKEETPTISVSDVVGNYTFTGIRITDFSSFATEEVNYAMSIKQASDNALTISGFMGIDGIQATYLPEVEMIQIVNQEIGEIVVGQSYGDIFFTVANGGLELISPAMVAPLDEIQPLVSIAEGKAVKENTNAIEGTQVVSAATIYVRNGAIYVNCAEPAAVEVYNAAGVQVYADAAVNGPITLPRGIYFVKVGNAKAVSVAL